MRILFQLCHYVTVNGPDSIQWVQTCIYYFYFTIQHSNTEKTCIFYWETCTGKYPTKVLNRKFERKKKKIRNFHELSMIETGTTSLNLRIDYYSYMNNLAIFSVKLQHDIGINKGV